MKKANIIFAVFMVCILALIGTVYGYQTYTQKKTQLASITTPLDTDTGEEQQVEQEEQEEQQVEETNMETDKKQTGTLSTVKLKVVGTDGEALSFSEVSLLDDSGNSINNGLTNADGLSTLFNVPYGMFTAEVTSVPGMGTPEGKIILDINSDSVEAELEVDTSTMILASDNSVGETVKDNGTGSAEIDPVELAKAEFGEPLPMGELDTTNDPVVEITSDPVEESVEENLAIDEFVSLDATVETTTVETSNAETTNVVNSSLPKTSAKDYTVIYLVGFVFALVGGKVYLKSRVVA